MITTTNTPSRQRGIAAVETAIVLPLLALLFLATAEFGRGFMQYNTLEKGVRDAARHLATNAIDGFTGVVNVTPALEAQAKNLARFGNIAGSGPTLLPSYTAAMVAVTVPAVDHVMVTANYPYQSMLFPVTSQLPSFGFGAGTALSFTMQASVIMRAL